MSQKEFKYDAFISYRHAELDIFAAETLHRQLESFKVPKIADREIKETGKQGIKRVFRDKDELPLVGNLSAPITEALKESEFLIVICSPRTMESLWVQREIEIFLEYRDASHILAVLIEGEPKESFPPQICILKKEIISEDGTVSYEEMEIEPLAADVRGKSKKEIKAKLKKEILRMAAPMLGCEYDDLKQRHRERKIKRQLTTFAVAGTVCLAFGAFSTYQAIRIHRQSKQIQVQAESLIEENRKNQILQSKSLSDTAVELYEDGDKMGALLVALAGVPEDLENPERPVVAESTAALSKILQVYENETSYEPHVMLEHDTITETSVLNEDGTILVSLDQLGQLYSWDMETGKMLAKAEDNVEIVQAENMVFSDKTSVLCGGNNGLASMNANDFSVKWSVPDIDVTSLVLSEDKSMAAVSGGGFITIYNTATGEEISSYKNEAWNNMGKCMRFSPDGNYLASSVTGYFDNGPGKGILLRTDSCELIRTYETEFVTWDQVMPTNEGVCYIVSYNGNEIGEYGTTVNQNLSCFNQDGSLRFEKAGMMSVFSKMELFGENVCYPDGSSLCIASQADGSIVKELHYNSSIRNYEIFQDTSIVVAGLMDGSVFITLLGGQEELTQQYLSSKDINMRHVYYEKNKIIEEPANSNQIFVFKNALGSKAQQITELSSNIWKVEATSNNKLLLAYDGNGVTAYELDNENVLYQIESEELVKKLILIEEEEQFLLIGNSSIKLYDLFEGKLIKQLKLEGSGYFDEISRQYVEYKGKNLVLYNTNNLEQMASYEIGMFNKAYISGDKKIVVGIDNEKNGFYYNLEAKEKITMEFAADNLVPNSQGTEYIVADLNTNRLSIYEFGQMTSKASVKMNVDFIKSLGFSPDGEKIFIGYKDDSLEIYEANGLIRIKTMKNMPSINRWETIGTGSMELLYDQDNIHTGYLLNNDMELLYEIPAFQEISPDGTTVYSSSRTKILSFPVYSLQMLVDEARELLDGRQLTKEEQERYYVN